MKKYFLSGAMVCLFLFAGCRSSNNSSSSDAPCSPNEIYAKQQLSPDTTIQADFTETVMVNLHEGHAENSIIEHEVTYQLSTAKTLLFTLNPSVTESIALVDSAGAIVLRLSSADNQAVVSLQAGSYVLHVLAAEHSRDVMVIQPQNCNSSSASTTPSSSAVLSSQSVAPFQKVDYPGVYIGYVSQTRSVYASTTDVTGFWGVSSAGLYNTPTLITSFEQFAQTFGAPQVGQPLGYAIYEFFLQGGQEAYVVRINAGAPIPTASELIAGYSAFSDIEILNLFVAPDLLNLSASSASQVVNALMPSIALRNAFFIVDPPSELATVEDALSFKASLTGGGELSSAALYFPFLYLEGDLSLIALGAGGNAAGIYANVDSNYGVWVSPAGITNGVLSSNIEELALTLTESQMASLTASDINSIISYNNQNLLYGARTLSSETLYINQQRLANSIEQSITQSLQWVVFQPDDPILWENVTVSISNYMTDLWAAGALYGPTAPDSYDVICDETNNPPEEILSGILNVTVTYYDSPGAPKTLEFSFQIQ